MPRNEMEPLLTLSEVAELLRVTPKTVRNKVSRGEIPRAPLAGILRFRRADIEQLVGVSPTDVAA